MGRGSQRLRETRLKGRLELNDEKARTQVEEFAFDSVGGGE